MASGGGGAGGTKDESAKHVLDEFGQKVHKEVKNGGAETYKNKLKGDLSQATFEGKKIIGSPPCDLDHRYHTNVTEGHNKENPCVNRSNIRFSDVRGGECADSKIKGNNTGPGGACAPYRRLHVCDNNLENINDYKNINNDTLLVDVCLAAKYEGETLTTQHGKHQLTYPGYHSQICTELARSFADIGDIVRGKDLYSGNNKEKVKLEKKLKKIFGKIHDKLLEDNKTNGALQARYEGDKQNNFYQLREDWWYANRNDVWKALTCKAEGAYFHATCSMNGSGAQARNQCRCDGANIVPTYFDYVPQYLRWFEEWAEDFCRKRKKQLTDAIQNCRGQDGSGKKLYCDLNRYDCKRTAKGKNQLVEGADCKKCSYSCIPFRTWIYNQKEEFEKQKQKYDKEITKADGKNRTSIKIGNTTINNLYVKDFYDEIKNNYGEVNKFLVLLSKEAACKEHPKIKNKNYIDFTESTEETFSHTEYCQACPWCGMDCTDDGTCTKKEDSTCQQQISKKQYPESNTTDIPVLTPEKGKSNILDKYKNFCENGANGGGQIKEWQCHYDEDKPSKENDNCVEGTWDNFTQGKNVMPYNKFFWEWVYHMLHDSVEWKTELSKCINNKNKCTNKCHGKCKCYESWAKRKEIEWDKIKEHFGKQKNIRPEGPLAAIMTPDIILEQVLDKKELLEIIEGTYGKSKETEHIEELLDEEEAAVAADGVTGQKSIIVELLEHEKKIAKECLQTHTKDDCPQPPKPPKPASTSDVSRSADPSSSPAGGDEKEFEEEEEEEEEEEGGEGAEQGEEETAEVENLDGESEEKEEKEVPGPTTTPGVTPACEIVQTLFGDKTNLTKACKQKYDGKYYGWKCVTPSGVDTTTKSSDSGSGEQPTSAVTPTTSGADSAPSGATTSGGSEPTKSGDTTGSGSICVPPRRRKLYVGKLQEWAKSDETTKGPTSQESDKSPLASTLSAASTSTSQTSLLRDAFIQSAAIETFFLWHRYKKEWLAQKKAEQGLNGLGGEAEGVQPLSGGIDSPSGTLDPNDPGNLYSGKIPPSFLRQMFYTLGDYRDILMGNTDMVGDTIVTTKDSGGSSETKKISEIIEGFLKKQPVTSPSPRGTSPPTSGPPNSVQQRESWWQAHGPDIWNGMIYALTYKTDTASGTALEQIDEVRKALLDEKNKPKKNAGPESNPHDYTYEKVELKEDNENGAKTAAASGEKTTLVDFISRPPYFRYLEEWGETFCRQRTRMLKDVKDNCRNIDEPGHHYCSGDGHDCTDDNHKYNDMSADPDCPDCYKQCRKYRKWIDIKFVEYHKQENTYKVELQKLNGNSSGDYKKLKGYSTAAEFLKSLKHCKNDQNSENKGNQEEEKKNEINFENIPQTFSHSTYCKACPVYGVKKYKETYTPIDQKDYKIKKDSTGENENDKSPTIIDVLVLDRKGEDKDNNLDNTCRNTGLFEDTSVQNWKCQHLNGIDECNLNNAVKSEYYDTKIPFNVLLRRWLQGFLEGYYISKRNIDICIKNENSCIQGCKGKCECVQEWLKQKTAEWQQINDHFKKQKHDDEAYNIKYKVRSCFEKDPFLSDFRKAMKGVKDIKGFEELGVCDDNECYNHIIRGIDHDFITELLRSLKDKINKCNTQPNKPQPNCDDSLNPHDDDPEPPEEDPDTSITSSRPDFCPKEPEVEPETPPGASEDAGTEEEEEPPAPSEPATDNEQPKEEEPEKKVPEKKEKPRKPQPTQPYLPPALKNAMLSSTIMWTVGIGFAAFTYFFLKVLYIYINIYGCGCICMCGCVWIYICVYVCVLYIFYIYVFILIKKKMKKRKKEKRNIKKNLLK